MALTQTDLDALDQAIASGVLTCELDGQRVTYQSTDQLMRARAFVEKRVLGAAGVSRPPDYSIGVMERF